MIIVIKGIWPYLLCGALFVAGMHLAKFIIKRFLGQ
jgi:hypothetical protein